jgi:UDP-N-acetyl-D-mannosaminuronic acid dehydrogenase
MFLTSLSYILTNMSKKILVIGGGFVGLTLSAKLVKAKNTTVTVLEVDTDRLASLSSGNFYVNEPGLHSILLNAIAKKTLNFTGVVTSSNYDAAFICIGTPPSIISENLPGSIFSLVNLVSICLKKNGMVFLRSTVEIGTTEKFAASVQKTGREDISIYFLPERTAEGVALIELDILPQIIGAASNSKIELIDEFLHEIGFAIVKCSNAESAEFVKLISNAWRDTIFGVSNEIALMAESIDLDAAEIIYVANFNYPRANIPSAGPVGGPCLYKDSHILLNSFSKEFREKSIIYSARAVNEKVELNIYELLLQHLEVGSGVLFIGAAFKGSPKTNDIRNGLTSNLIRRIQESKKQINVQIWDPTLEPTDLLDLAQLKINSLTDLSPKVIVIGNNSQEIISESVIDFLNKLPSNTLIIDPWRMYQKSKKTRAKIYHLGRGLVNDSEN